MKEKLKNLRYIVILFIVAILVSIPLFWKNLDFYHDDGVQHIYRAISTQENMNNYQSTAVLLDYKTDLVIVGIYFMAHYLVFQLL